MRDVGNELRAEMDTVVVSKRICRTGDEHGYMLTNSSEYEMERVKAQVANETLYEEHPRFVEREKVLHLVSLLSRLLIAIIV